MFDTKETKRISAGLLFTICALIGMVCFIGIYGVRILDFTNTGWLFDNDHDLRQHYIGWCHFRSDMWRFPIGLIDSLSYPNSMSVIYTDSIPLFAVIFKIISPALPVTFQYFGLFGIMSFALMGGFSSLLLRRFIDSDIACAIGSVFYVISSTVIHRMYYHTALAAQFIVVACLVLWVYDDLIPSRKKRAALWAAVSFMCVAIHSYFLPMAGMILAATVVTRLFLKKDTIADTVILVLSFCAAGLINLYILGGFYGGTSPSGPGLGTFGSNLNAFVNPWEIGKLLPQLPIQNYFQYEGMAYLGAGIFLLFALIFVGLLFRTIRKVPEEAFHSRKIYGNVTLILFIVSFTSAVLPNISWGERVLLWVPYPPVVEKILGIFRSNGRLVWPAMYILITAAISFTAYTFRRYRYVAVIALSGALLLQIYDMSDTFASKYEHYTYDRPVETIWDVPEVSAFVDGAHEFIFMYEDNDITMQTAYYGYLHNMRQNNFYFARDIGDKVREEIRLYESELENGNMRDDAVYVIKEEDYGNNASLYDGLDADVMHAFEHVIMRARK